MQNLFQGEVAGNYAGPFNSNSRIQNVTLKISPLETVGALNFNYDTIDRNLGNTEAMQSICTPNGTSTST